MPQITEDRLSELENIEQMWESIMAVMVGEKMRNSTDDDVRALMRDAARYRHLVQRHGWDNPTFHAKLDEELANVMA